MSKKSVIEYVTLQNVRVKVYQFDNLNSLIERYAAHKTKSGPSQKPYILPALPQYFRFSTDQQDYKIGDILDLKSDVNYEIEDIRDIRDMQFSLVIDTIAELLGAYKSLRLKDIISIYFVEQGNTRISIEQFNDTYESLNVNELLKEHGIRDRSLTNSRITYITISKYEKDAALQHKKFLSRAKKYETIYTELLKNKPIVLGDFIIEGTIEEINLQFSASTSLYEVFDALQASYTTPFIVFSNGETLFYKIYAHIRPIAEWLDIGHRVDKQHVIYFYVLDTDTKTSKLSHTDYGDIYRGCVWTLSSVDEIIKLSTNLTLHTIRVDSRGAVTYVHNILENMQKTNNFNIISETQYETRGKFTIGNEYATGFNKAVFADLITNSDVFSSLLYFDENSKSVLDKKRYVYYHDAGDFTGLNNYVDKLASDNKTSFGKHSSAITITMTDTITDVDSRIDVRVSRASTEIQIERFMVLFSYLYSMYIREKNKVIDRYVLLYKPANFKKYEKKATVKHIDIKTGKRLKLLEQHNPAAFKHGGYSSKCQPKRRQPYLVPKNELDKVRKQFKEAEPKELAKELEQHGLLEWPTNSGDWYACYPREPDDDEKRHIWPGLIKQNEKASNYDKYPLLPCCFIANQFTKKGSKKADDTEPEDTGAEDQFDRPLSSNKPTPRGRYAELPYYLQIAVENAGYTLVEYRKKMFLPILRYGVIEGLDSMVHCMEKAFNDDYSAMTIDDKKARVKDVLDTLSQKDDEWLVVCKQEMYDYSYDDIRESLTNADTYIDPDMYINLFAKHYDCNIIVFKVDEQNPKGEVALPRFSKAHLSYKFNPKTETVVIVKMQSKRARVGSALGGFYQCELVVKYEKNGINYVFDSKDKFIIKCYDILSKINDVYIISANSDNSDVNYIKYDPQILL